MALAQSVYSQNQGMDTMGTKVTPSNESQFGAPDLHIYNAKKKHVRGNSKLDPVGPPQKSLHLEDLNISGSQQTQMLK